MTTETEMQSDGIDPYYIWTGKTAVALALIRNKPEGLTAKQYAEQLGSSFMRSQLYHKQRLEKLADTLHLPPQPTCTGGNGDETEEGHEPAFLTPPFSSEDPRRLDQPQQQQPNHPDAGLHDQVKLLQSILCLRSLPSTATLTNWEMQDMYLVNVSRAFDTLSQALTGEVEGPVTLPTSLISDAVGVICHLISSQLSPSVTSTVMHKTQDLLQNLMVTIINQDGVNQMEKQDLKCMVLLQLGRCSKLRAGILTLLARCLSHFGGGLHQVLSKEMSCQPHVCENMFYIFDCMEKLLLDIVPPGDCVQPSGGTAETNKTYDSCKTSKDSREQNKKGEAEIDHTDLRPSDTRTRKHGLAEDTNSKLDDIALPKEVLDTISIQLEDSLVLISQHFPCYAYAVWHLKGLLDQVQGRDNTA